MLTTTPLFLSAVPFLIWGIVAHLVADWLLQNVWQAKYKRDLRHPAAWVHSGIHTALYLLVFPWHIAVLLGLTHILIDTRKPLQWWDKYVEQSHEGEIELHVMIWRDQVLHILCIAIAALIVAAR
jgi:hypothetical protein